MTPADSPIITGEEPDSEKVRLPCAALLGVAPHFLPAGVGGA